MAIRSATILICTHNRAAMLSETLAAVTRFQSPASCDVEVIVVDNRSADATRAIVERAASEARTCDVRYAFEEQLGKSYALNRGLALARGEVVLLTDDDVLPCEDWLERIVEHFRCDASLQFVYGKVLPRWAAQPPPMFTDPRIQPLWGPLGLLDHGDTVQRHVDDDRRRRLPIGGNLAFRRETLVAVGGWRTDLGKVDNTLICGEDHEIFLRLRRVGLYVGVYDPAIRVRHFIPETKVRTTYFRHWFYWRGKTIARMADDVYRPLDLTRTVRIFGIPRFLFRQCLQQVRQLVWRSIVGDRVDRLVEQAHTVEYFGMFSEFIRQRDAGGARM